MLYEKLCEVLSEQLAVSKESITMDTSFVEDLGVESLDVVDITMAIEEAFDIPEFDEDVIADLKTVGDLYQYLTQICD